MKGLGLKHHFIYAAFEHHGAEAILLSGCGEFVQFATEMRRIRLIMMGSQVN